ncbi:MAG: response regulator, partial [bacterium]
GPRLRAARAGVRSFFARGSDVRAIAATVHAALAPVGPARRSALVVDDDPHYLQAIEAVLRVADFDVVTLTDPLQLWNALQASRPDVAIIDLDMPGASGFELCRALRASAEWKGLYVVVVTARDAADATREAFAAGANDLITKPFAPDELLARLQHSVPTSHSQRTTPIAVTTNTPALRDEPLDDTAGFDVDVCVVDDDAILVELLTQSLASRGYRTLAIGDGGEAVRALTGRTPAVRARVIVLDVGLPGQDGFTVLRLLHREGVTKRSRVIMLTLRSTEQEVVEALELGAVDHVAKPFSVPILMQRIRRLIETGA